MFEYVITLLAANNYKENWVIGIDKREYIGYIHREYPAFAGSKDMARPPVCFFAPDEATALAIAQTAATKNPGVQVYVSRVSTVIEGKVPDAAVKLSVSKLTDKGLMPA